MAVTGLIAVTIRVATRAAMTRLTPGPPLAAALPFTTARRLTAALAFTAGIGGVLIFGLRRGVTMGLAVALSAMLARRLIGASRTVLTRRIFAGGLADQIVDPEVMFRVLKVIFSGDTIACGCRVARESEIFFINLEGIAADAHIRTIAVEGLMARRDVLSPAVDVGIVASTSAARTPRVRSLSHSAFLGPTLSLRTPLIVPVAMRR